MAQAPPTVPKAHQSWSKYKAAKDERYVDIFYADQGGILITYDYPLSILMTYSKLARKELGPLLKSKGKITWNIRLPSQYGQGTDISGLLVVLKWMLTSLPARGYSANYKGHPQLFGDLVEGKTLEEYIRILEAVELLDLAAPLNRQKAIPEKITSALATDDYTTNQVEMMHTLLRQTSFAWLVKAALNSLVDFFDDRATDEEKVDINSLQARNTVIGEAIMTIRKKKQGRIDAEKRKQEYEARQQKREEREERKRKQQAKKKRDGDINSAADGGRALREHEVDRVMRRD